MCMTKKLTKKSSSTRPHRVRKLTVNLIILCVGLFCIDFGACFTLVFLEISFTG